MEKVQKRNRPQNSKRQKRDRPLFDLKGKPMINKKKVLACVIILILLIVIIVAAIQIRNTLARYETTTETERNVDVAFWVVDNSFQTQRLILEDIKPNTIPYEYAFSVSNFNGSKTAETDIEYQIVLTTTTNIPLSYQITRNGTFCAEGGELYPGAEESELYTDSDGTVYREIRLGTTENPLILDTIHDTTRQKIQKTDNFVVKVTFPQSYSANEDYKDLIENIQIDLSARQIIDE